MNKQDLLMAIAVIGITFGGSEIIYGAEPVEIDKGAVYEYFDKNNVYCNYIQDISVDTYGNIEVYHIVCKNNDSFSIYDFTPAQLVQTYYIED